MHLYAMKPRAIGLVELVSSVSETVSISFIRGCHDLYKAQDRDQWLVLVVVIIT
jgi:hypothetical protein